MINCGCNIALKMSVLQFVFKHYDLQKSIIFTSCKSTNLSSESRLHIENKKISPFYELYFSIRL